MKMTDVVPPPSFAETASHTPTPWELLDTKPMSIEGNIIRVVDKDRYPMAFIPAWNEPGPGEEDGSEEAAANAAFIVMAVNGRQALLARIARLEADLLECREFIEDYVDVNDGDYGEPAPNRAMQLVSLIDGTLNGRPY